MTRYTGRPVFRMLLIAMPIAIMFVLKTHLARLLGDHLAALVLVLTFAVIAIALITPPFMGRR